MNMLNTTVINPDIITSITSQLSLLIDSVRGFANTAAIIALIGCGLYLIFGSNPRYIEKAKSWGIAIIIGLIIINGADPIVKWAQNVAGGLTS